jgi:8-oxoguanine deaminase
VLGRDDIGVLAPGMCADLIAIDIRALPFAGGAVHDPVAALIFCQPANVSLSVIDGRVRVRDGEIVGLDLREAVSRHNTIATDLVRGELATRRVW